MSTPLYGERADITPPAPETKTKIINEVPTNESDVLVARENTKRSMIRAGGTVATFGVIMLPVIIAMLRVVPQ